MVYLVIFVRMSLIVHEKLWRLYLDDIIFLQRMHRIFRKQIEWGQITSQSNQDMSWFKAGCNLCNAWKAQPGLQPSKRPTESLSVYQDYLSWRKSWTFLSTKELLQECFAFQQLSEKVLSLFFFFTLHSLRTNKWSREKKQVERKKGVGMHLPSLWDLGLSSTCCSESPELQFLYPQPHEESFAGFSTS